jgi:DNA-binding IclR family transcriptional regulator
MSHPPAQCAVRTLRALEVLAFTPTTAPKLAAVLGVHPRTARRLLGQLLHDGWLSYCEQSPRVYAPTLRLVALASQIGARAPLATLTASAVEQLHAATGMDATLAIPAYNATVCLAHCAGARATQPPLDATPPAHCTAPGKVLMAHRDAWRRAILGRPLDGCTPRSVTDPDALERELEIIRQVGYASEDGEHVDGRRQLAAPVTGPDGETLAAITVAGHDAVAPGPVLDTLRDAARCASEALVSGAERYPLRRAIVYRLLASYGLAPVDAYL